MNKVILIGRLTKDPDLKFIPTTGTATTTFTIAVDNYNSKTQEKSADFIQVVSFGKQAENVAQYMLKGNQIAVSGKLRTRAYDAKDGTKRYVTEVVADLYGGVQFLDSKNKGPRLESNEQDVFGEEAPVDYGEMPF